MSRRIDQNKTPDPPFGRSYRKLPESRYSYRLAILDFAEAAIPAQTTQDSAFVEAGIVAGRLLLQFLGLGVTRKGGLTLIPSREYHTDNGFTDEVKVIDIGRRFVDIATLDAETADALAHFHNGASKASAHFTWDSGHRLDFDNLRQCIPIIRTLVLTHLPSHSNGV